MYNIIKLLHKTILLSILISSKNIIIRITNFVDNLEGIVIQNGQPPLINHCPDIMLGCMKWKDENVEYYNKRTEQDWMEKRKCKYNTKFS